MKLSYFNNFGTPKQYEESRFSPKLDEMSISNEIGEVANKTQKNFS